MGADPRGDHPAFDPFMRTLIEAFARLAKHGITLIAQTMVKRWLE